MTMLKLAAALAAILFLPAGAAGASDDYLLAPQTKLRVTVVEWVAISGEYRRWDALDGEYAVTAGGTVSIPLIGVVDAQGLTSDELGARMAEMLQTKTGLRSLPDVSVSIVEYPSIYAVGDVASPGAYPYRPGMTVLQVLSLAGGREREREDWRGVGLDQIRYLGELEALRGNLDRSMGRRARLQAEADAVPSADAITFPEQFQNEYAQGIVAEEKAIFTARSDAIERQLESLSELQTLLTTEVELLQEKLDAQDQQIGSVREELEAVLPLVSKGIATASRRYEVERRLTDLQSDRLDLVTAIMRARQSLSNASRDALNLRGERQIEISRQLQETESEIEDAELDSIVTGRLLAETAVIAARLQDVRDQQDIPLRFSIVRRTNEGQSVIEATEASLVAPGDVMRVEVDRSFLARGSAGLGPARATGDGEAPDEGLLTARSLGSALTATGR